jgi:hypothetical protein
MLPEMNSVSLLSHHMLSIDISLRRSKSKYTKAHVLQMCLKGTVCFDNGCLLSCDLCLAFTVENLTGIANGDKIHLGSLKDMIGVANAGCNFCRPLVNGALSSKNGNVRRYTPTLIVILIYCLILVIRIRSKYRNGER